MPKKLKAARATHGFGEEPSPFRHDFDATPLKATTEIGKDGRIVIPAAMREAMGVKDGSTLILVMKGETLEVFTAEASLRRIQEALDRVVPKGVSLADELIADRRREVEEEEND